MTSSSDKTTHAVLWMLAQLDPSTQDRVRRRISLRLDPPVSPTDRRRRELRFVSDLLRVFTPPDGWSFAYMQRKQYDADRPTEAPSSAVLVGRYGSWVEVCRHAHALATRGRLLPLPRHRHAARNRRLRYSRNAMVAALQECAGEINRLPSRRAYSLWRLAAERRRPTWSCPSESTVTRAYEERGGWRAALEDAGLIEPPAMTIRALAPAVETAEEIAAAARAAGLIATRARARRCVEIRGTPVEVKAMLSRSVFLEATVTLWEPRSRRLERVQPDRLTSRV